MADDLAELEKKAWAEFSQTLDEYIAHYTSEIDKFLKSRDKTAMPNVPGSDDGHPFKGAASEPGDAVQGKPDPERD